MKAPTVILVSVLALVAGASTVRTQDNTSLYGKVRGEDHKQASPPDWKAEVFAVVAGNNGAISTESDEDLYLLQVPTNAKVTLWFHSPGYIPKELRSINTGTNSKKAVRPSLVVLTKPLGDSLTRTRTERQQVIGAIIDFGIATGAVDLVMYDLGVIRATVANNLEAVMDIVQARSKFSLNPRVQPLITPERQERWLLFDKVIIRNLGNNIEIDPASLLAAVKNESLPYGLRYEAIRALATPDSDTQSNEKGASRNLVVRQQALTYFRQQSLDSTSTLFAPSRYALAKIGTDADKQTIIADVRSDDLDRAAAAISALGRANFVSGNEVVAQMAENPNVDPSIRMVAIQSLDALAARRENVRIAVESLTRILETGADPDPIRIQAADALTNAQLSDGQRLRIQKVANQDPSANIRAAAGGLGTVKSLQRRIP